MFRIEIVAGVYTLECHSTHEIDLPFHPFMNFLMAKFEAIHLFLIRFLVYYCKWVEFPTSTGAQPFFIIITNEMIAEEIYSGVH